MKKESVLAIVHWWGVGHSTVHNWRKIYGVQPSNPGTAILKREYTKLPFFRASLRKAWSKARDPVRCDKIAASKRGKKRPHHVIAKMMAAKLGKPLPVAAKLATIAFLIGNRAENIGPQGWPWVVGVVIAGASNV